MTKLLRTSVLVLVLLFPTLAHGQRCVVDVVVLNVDRQVYGPVAVECSRPPHSIPFGNWGAEFRYFGKYRLRNGYQFSGWKADDGWLQWNSCTTRFPAPDPRYYNAGDEQIAVPNVVNVVETRRDHTYTGEDGIACMDLLENPVIEVGSPGEPVELRVYELDFRITIIGITIDGPDLVATLAYKPIAIPYNCASEWNCRGESSWVPPVRGHDRVSARLKLEVHLRAKE